MVFTPVQAAQSLCAVSRAFFGQNPESRAKHGKKAHSATMAVPGRPRRCIVALHRYATYPQLAIFVKYMKVPLMMRIH